MDATSQTTTSVPPPLYTHNWTALYVVGPQRKWQQSLWQSPQLFIRRQMAQFLWSMHFALSLGMLYGRGWGGGGQGKEIYVLNYRSLMMGDPDSHRIMSWVDRISIERQDVGIIIGIDDLIGAKSRFYWTTLPRLLAEEKKDLTGRRSLWRQSGFNQSIAGMRLLQGIASRKSAKEEELIRWVIQFPVN